MAKRYFWLKLMQDFFKGHKISLLLREKRGKEIVLFYIFLLTEGIAGEGRLGYDETRGYTEMELAHLTGFSPAMTRNALKHLMECGFVRLESDGALFLPELPGMIGSESSRAENKRKERQKKLRQCRDIVAESKSIEIEKEKESELDLLSGGAATYQQLDLTDEQREQLKQLMGPGKAITYINKLEQFIRSRKAKVKDPYQTILKWYQEDCK